MATTAPIRPTVGSCSTGGPECSANRSYPNPVCRWHHRRADHIQPLLAHFEPLDLFSTGRSFPIRTGHDAHYQASRRHLGQAKVMFEVAAGDSEGARLDNDTVPEQLTTFAEPIARGPVGLGAATTMIDDWEVSAQPSSGALTLQDQSALAKLEVRSKANGAVGKQLETNFGRVHQREQGS